MQLANSREDDPALRSHVRRAGPGDAAALQRLLRMGVYVHIHIDWHLPGDWLNRPGFFVSEESGSGKETEDSSGPITSCLCVAADPPPAAWVRVAAVNSPTGFPQTQMLFDHILAELDPSVDEIAWFLTDYWPLHWLERLGFVPVSEVIGFRKHGLDSPPYQAPSGLIIRPLMTVDIPALATIEKAAFEPRWRHSASDLMLAWRHSISFTVALIDGDPVAYQFSTGGNGNAHLSRMTVHPEHQGRGIGAALLANAFDGYKLQKINTITLNTQSDNMASRRLYERFGFEPTGHSYPIWSFFPKR